MRETLVGLEPDLLLMESQTMKGQMQGMLSRSASRPRS